MDIQKKVKKGLKEKDPKILLLIGVVLVIVALLAKLLLIAGLVIILVVVYTWYKTQKKPQHKTKEK